MPRAGTSALNLLSSPLTAFTLEALKEGPQALVDLRRRIGLPPQTTARAHLRGLAQIEVVTRRRHSDFPGSVHYELGPAGRDLISVTEVLRAWLAAAPHGPLPLGSVAAKSTIKALVEGWTTIMLRALAARPLSLTELDDLISGCSYPSLERRLAAMRIAGQIEPTTGNGRGTPYAVTEWVRRAVAPLIAATRWERRYLRHQAAPLSGRDAEAVLLLSVPLLTLPADLSGSCRLVVETAAGDRQRLAGVMITVDRGAIASCSSNFEGRADAWIVGSSAAWLAAAIELEAGQLEMGGDVGLARGILEALHETLFRDCESPVVP